MNDYMESLFDNFDFFTPETFYNTDLEFFNISSEPPSFTNVCCDALSSIRTFIVKTNDNICVKFFNQAKLDLHSLFFPSFLFFLFSFWRKILKFWFYNQN
jgi:hypothetical protein